MSESQVHVGDEAADAAVPGGEAGQASGDVGESAAQGEPGEAAAGEEAAGGETAGEEAAGEAGGGGRVGEGGASGSRSNTGVTTVTSGRWVPPW